MVFTAHWIWTSVILLALLPVQYSSSGRRTIEFNDRTNVNQESRDFILHGDLEQSSNFDPTNAIRLSWHPRLFQYPNFLSDEECDHLISLANGTNKITGWLFETDELVARIDERISAWTFLPKDNGEPIKILHSEIEQSSEAQYVYSYNRTDFGGGDYMIATVMIFLSNVSMEGETIFPRSEMKDAQIKDNSWSLCSSNGYAVKPIKGNALLFFHRHHNSEPDEGSLHGNCAVLGGDKWTANKWIHVLPFTGIKNSFLHDSDNIGCTDEEDMYAEWAANGECDRNRIYMLGNSDYYGSCRKSCGLC